MGKSAILSVRILSDAKGAVKGLDQVDDKLAKTAENAKKIAAGFAIAGAAAGAALTKGLFDAVDADSANRKLAGQLGLGAADAAAAGELSGRLYRDAYGESLEEVNTAVAAVGSTLADMSANGGADVERLSKKAMDLAGTFDVDVNEAVSTAGALMKNGLAADGDEAFDLLVGSMQKMPAAMQSELLPVMDEYSKHFADLGISGNDAMGMMVNASADGAIGMDKLGDSLKELTIRSTDMSTGTAGAYEAMGLNMDEMTGKMLAGGDQASEAFGMIVAGLQNIEDPGAQAAAAIALFGTPLEDLGTAGIPDFLGAIDPMGDAFDSVAGSADKLAETVNSGPGPAIESFKREALGALQDMAANALPYIQPMLDKLTEFMPILAPLAVALAAIAIVIATVTAAMAIFNAVMALSPITWIVIAVVALIAALVLAYNNIGWFKDAVNTAGAIASAVFSTIVSWVTTAVSWLVNVIGQSQTFQAAIDLIGAVFSLMGTLAQAAWDLVVAGVTTAIDWVKSITTESETFQTVMSGLGDIATTVFGAIDTAISTTIGWVQSAVGWFQSLFGAKNDANSVAVDGGSAGSSGSFALDPQALAAPRMMSFAAADPLALAYSATGAASYGATTAPTASALTAATVGVLQAGRAAAAGSVTNVNVTVKADATTDKAALGRELIRSINTALTTAGKPKLV